MFSKEIHSTTSATFRVKIMEFFSFLFIQKYNDNNASEISKKMKN